MYLFLSKVRTLNAIPAMPIKGTGNDKRTDTLSMKNDSTKTSNSVEDNIYNSGLNCGVLDGF